MVNEHDAAAQWDRVASELRACRQVQQEAYGDIDNATLGRYLAGEASSAEREEVEAALVAHPELRALTDLVLDVLTEFEPERAPVLASIVIPPAPVLLPLGPREARPWAKRFLAGARRRAPLLAAACLLLTLGVAMPRSGLIHAERSGTDLPVAASSASSRLDVALGATDRLPPLPALPEPPPAPFFVANPPSEGADRAEARPVASLTVVERERSTREAASFNNLGLTYQKQGDLEKAAVCFARAHNTCRENLGPGHPATVWTVRHLANVYQAALDDQRPSPGVNPYLSAAPAGGARPAGRFSSARGGADVTPASGTFVCRPAKDQPGASQLRDKLINCPQGEVRASVVPVLIDAFRHSTTTQERVAIARALGELGPAAREAVPVLTESLRGSPAPLERQVFLLALSQVGPAAPGPVGKKLPDGLRERCEDRPSRDLLARLEGREGRVGINDEGGCFSVRALREGNSALRELACHNDLEVLIETASALDKVAPNRAADRLRDMGCRAVHVLIVPRGPVVRVTAKDLGDCGVSLEELRQNIESQVQKGNFDAGLEAGVKVLGRARGHKK